MLSILHEQITMMASVLGAWNLMQDVLCVRDILLIPSNTPHLFRLEDSVETMSLRPREDLMKPTAG